MLQLRLTIGSAIDLRMMTRKMRGLHHARADSGRAVGWHWLVGAGIDGLVRAKHVRFTLDGMRSSDFRMRVGWTKGPMMVTFVRFVFDWVAAAAVGSKDTAIDNAVHRRNAQRSMRIASRWMFDERTMVVVASLFWWRRLLFSCMLHGVVAGTARRIEFDLLFPPVLDLFLVLSALYFLLLDVRCPLGKTGTPPHFSQEPRDVRVAHVRVLLLDHRATLLRVLQKGGHGPFGC